MERWLVFFAHFATSKREKTNFQEVEENVLFFCLLSLEILSKLHKKHEFGTTMKVEDTITTRLDVREGKNKNYRLHMKLWLNMEDKLNA